MLPVSGALVELTLPELRREDVLVAVAPLEGDDEPFDLDADGRTSRQPQRQAGATLLVGREDAELSTEAPVIRVFHVVSSRSCRRPAERKESARGRRPGRLV